MRARGLGLLVLALLAAGCGGDGDEAARRTSSTAAPGPLLPEGFVRSPRAKTSQDTNPFNLASAVVTYSFGQLPEYIDEGEFRLLPYDLFRAASPGATVRRRYRITLPRTSFVLNTAVTAAPTSAEAKQLARDFSVRVSLDGRYVRDPNRYWVFYRNNGPQICRIYFPGDLGSLHMGANSLVWHPLQPGSHRLRVEVRQAISRTSPAARFVTDYDLRVLRRGPGPVEAAIAPPEDGPPPPSNRTPLTFRTPATGGG